MKKIILLLLCGLLYAPLCMADTKVSALTELDATPAGTDELYINDAGTSKKITYTNIMSGTAALATVAASEPTNCAAGSYPLGVDTSWDAETCTDATAEIDSVVATHMAIIADTSTIGHLNDTDWDTFNGKQAALGYTPVNSADWTTNNSYPATCTNQFVRALGDTNTCATVALTTDTSGNYAAGDGEAGNATSATTDTIDAITEIAAALKSGADGTLITGTKGADGICAEFNADGDLVAAASAAACGSGGTGDAVTVNGTAVDTTANFKDTTSLTFALVDGGVGGPDDVQGTVVVQKDIITTAPLTGAADNVLPGADADLTLAITMLKDIVTTAPLTGAEDNVLPGADADLTLAITVLKDLVTTAPLTGAADDVFTGADADITIAMPVATTSADGYLSQTDWDTFNDKGDGDILSVGDCQDGVCLSTGGNITADTVTSTTFTGALTGNSDTTTEVGVVTLNKWCIGDGSAVQCSEDAPSGAGDITGVGDCQEGECLVTGGNITADTVTSTTFNSTGLTASEIVITDASKNLSSAAVATYPSLTELSYVKGLESAIQTQLTGKLTTTLTDSNIFVGNGSNIATGVVVGGHATIDTAGSVGIQSQAISNQSLETMTTGDTVIFVDATDGTLKKGDVDDLLGSSSSGGAYTDADPVILSTTTNDVIIAGATQINSAKVSIDGDADQVQFSIQGHSTQSGNLIVFEQSDGTDAFTMDSVGVVVAAGSVTAGGAISGIVLGGETSDPCATLGEGAIFYNTTSNYMCFCNGTDDLKMNDNTTACF